MGIIKQNPVAEEVLLPGCECYRCQAFRLDQLPKPARFLGVSNGACNRCYRHMRTYLQPGIFHPKFCDMCMDFLQNSSDASKDILQGPHCVIDAHHVDCICLIMERAAPSNNANQVSDNGSLEGCGCHEC